MFTPLELEKIEFEGTLMGGYKKQDVEEVFGELSTDYENLYKENIASRDKIAMLEGVVEKYKTMEDSLQNALLLAQTSSDAAIRAAQEKAQNIIKEAETKAAYIIKAAEDNVKGLTQKEIDLRRELNVFVAKNVSQLRTQIEILNGMVTDNAGEQVVASMAAASTAMDVSPAAPISVPAEPTEGVQKSVPSAEKPLEFTQVIPPIDKAFGKTEN